jgi:FkbM family methyltransferase
MNISVGEQILCYKDHIIKKAFALQVYRSIYANYISVVRNMLRNRYPIEAILRSSNTHLTFENFMETTVITGFIRRAAANREKLEYDITKDTVRVTSIPYSANKTAKVILSHGITNGDVFAIFIDGVYKKLPVKDKIVIDIGANIGDSCIYFALCGASKVIGLEPFPKSYEIATKNIESNNCLSKVTLYLAGCAASTGFINIDPNSESNIGSCIENGKNNEQGHGQSVRLLTIEDIINEFGISSAESVLKIDCEGCEYDVILSASKNILRRFSHIHVEYHWGYRNLKEKLEKCGFNVLVTRPKLIYNPARKKMHIGDIYAERK